MKILLPGGSGQVGTILARAFHAQGHDVVVLSRSPAPAHTPWRTVQWDARTAGPWTAEVDGADVVINLAGRSVNCRYTAANRRAILDSRIDSTRAVAAAIASAARPPRVWLQASTATIYAHAGPEVLENFTHHQRPGIRSYRCNNAVTLANYERTPPPGPREIRYEERHAG
jgi:hypothetical protein